MSDRSIAHITADLISALAGISRLASAEALSVRCHIVQACYARSQSVDSLTLGELLQLSNTQSYAPSIHMPVSQEMSA